MNLSAIQSHISYEIKGNPSILETSTDWNNRLFPINRALIDWAETYDWKQLIKVHNGNVASSGNASYTLPVDFRRMMGFPKIILK